MRTSSNENTIYWNLLKIVKVLVRGKLKALNMFMNKNKRMRVNELNSQLKVQEQSKQKTRKK